MSFLHSMALRPVEARVTSQADEVLGPDLFDLLCRYIRLDPFELCFHPALSARAHGSPVTVLVDGACRGRAGRTSPPPFPGSCQSLAAHRPPPGRSQVVIKEGCPPLTEREGWGNG